VVGAHKLQILGAAAFQGYGFMPALVNKFDYAPKSWRLMCDEAIIHEEIDHSYTENRFQICFDTAHTCNTVQLVISSWHLLSTSRRDFVDWACNDWVMKSEYCDAIKSGTTSWLSSFMSQAFGEFVLTEPISGPVPTSGPVFSPSKASSTESFDRFIEQDFSISELDECYGKNTASCENSGGCVLNVAREVGVNASSQKDTEVYWNQADFVVGAHKLQILGAAAFQGYGFMPALVNKFDYAPKSWRLMCDEAIIHEEIDHSYTENRFQICFDTAHTCNTVQLVISSWHLLSTSRRDFVDWACNDWVMKSEYCDAIKSGTTSWLSSFMSQAFGEFVLTEPISGPVPTSGPVFPPSKASPTASVDDFIDQDFSISEPLVTLFDDDGQLFLELNYTVGSTVDTVNITLMNLDCTEIDDSVSTTIWLGYQRINNQFYSNQVFINKETFETSSIVLYEGAGFSAGTLGFCVKVEGLVYETSISFRNHNVKLSFDLTKNGFKVESIGIIENQIESSEANVTSSDQVEACRCTAETFQCDSNHPLPSLAQNAMVYVCLKPSIDSIGVEILNFVMRFEQDSEVKFEAVTIGTNGPRPVTGLSSIKQEGDTFKIATRLVSVLFEKKSFNITGNAYLGLKSNGRYLSRTTPTSAPLYLTQDSSIEYPAGESQFNMNVNLLKAQGTFRNSSSRNSSTAKIVTGIITVVIFATAIIFFKKKGYHN